MAVFDDTQKEIPFEHTAVAFGSCTRLCNKRSLCWRPTRTSPNKLPGMEEFRMALQGCTTLPLLFRSQFWYVSRLSCFSDCLNLLGKDVSHLLNHSSSAITEKFYSSWMPDRTIRLERLFAEAFQNSVGGGSGDSPVRVDSLVNSGT